MSEIINLKSKNREISLRQQIPNIYIQSQEVEEVALVGEKT